MNQPSHYDKVSDTAKQNLQPSESVHYLWAYLDYELNTCT